HWFAIGCSLSGFGHSVVCGHLVGCADTSGGCTEHGHVLHGIRHTAWRPSSPRPGRSGMNGPSLATIGLVQALAAAGRLSHAEAGRYLGDDPDGRRLAGAMADLLGLGLPILAETGCLTWRPP